MSWRTEWKAISDRIQGLLEAGHFFFAATQSYSNDSYGVMTRVLFPEAKKIFDTVRKFQKTYATSLPPGPSECLSNFMETFKANFPDNGPGSNMASAAVQITLTALSSFRSEFAFQLSDMQAIARRTTERAFIHLQRTIMVDPTVGKRWREAFKKTKTTETTCEQFGAVHLLLHGIWAFKVDAKGGRTDLVLSKSLLDTSQVESTADALVLTEWKIVRNKNELDRRAEEAYEQAAKYSAGVLAGFELATHRYLVLVSERELQALPDRNDGSAVYHHISIAVDPALPSKTQ